MTPPPAPDLIQKKVSNAFFSNDQTDTMGHTYGGTGLLLIQLFTGQLFTGGVWLGGNTYLTSTSLIFELNALNKLFHSGASRVEIPLVEVSKVTVKPAVGFKIIQLTIPQGDFQIRVRGAKEFASLIEETAAKAKSGIG